MITFMVSFIIGSGLGFGIAKRRNAKAAERSQIEEWKETGLDYKEYLFKKERGLL